jgi:predicted  nucleic acid-binding Zn-ribbon protein
MTNDLFNKMTPEQEEMEIKRVTDSEFMDKELREVANETIKELEAEVDKLTLENSKLEDQITDLEKALTDCENRMDQIRELAW